MFLSQTKPIKILFKDPLMFFRMYLQWGIKITCTKFTKKVFKPRHYAGKLVTPDYEGNEWIKKKLISGELFSVGRPGATEIYLIHQGMMLNNGLRKPAKDEDYKMAYINSGVFPRTAAFVCRYAPYAAKALASCDLLNVSYCVLEDYIYLKYMDPKAELTYIRALDYWRFENPWTMALKGKRVLVISPFAKTIEDQYKQRKKLYQNIEILPEFTLYTVKAVQTGGLENDDRFPDWFAALDYMYLESMKYDFDVAILSCGAYSLPLVAKFRESGKSAIHMGGVCQMLFGIKGRRWQDEPGAGVFFNENWVFPRADETPKSAAIVENSAYWNNDEEVKKSVGERNA